VTTQERIADLADKLAGIEVITKPTILRAKSRDFFWFSPVLKDALDHVEGDALIRPESKDELRKVLAACFELDIPVTPRGGGTGNYAQAMPITGGVVLDMTGLNRVISCQGGVLHVEAGALMGDIETHTHAEVGQELRMHPSTRETATIGGFVAGGSGGVGSIRWGMLHEPGNILGLEMMTMEAEPRLIRIEGPEINRVHHAYGINGVITEVTMPLIHAEDWVDFLVSFRDWDSVVASSVEIAGYNSLHLKELAAIQAPAPERYFTRHAKFLEEGDHLLLAMVAPNSAESFQTIVNRVGGRVAYRSDIADAADKKGLPHLHHLCWNHTTLRAIKTDPDITYLQLGTRAGDIEGSARDIARLFPEEIINHLEFSRGADGVRAGMLPLLRFTSKARMDEVIAALEDIGIQNWNPHAYTLEEGNYRDPDPEEKVFKARHDPKGLLNPGKLIAWETMDYRYDPAGGYVVADLQAKP